jgi:hypothetical protein
MENILGEVLTPQSNCGCCQLSSDMDTEAFGCSERSAVFTAREQAVLERIRESGARARELKHLIERLEREGPPQDLLVARSTYEELRELRKSLEAERLDAAEERMRLLGHA